jgi:ankyrin repeat protein
MGGAIFGEIMKNETPYPRLGELVHFIIHAFGLFDGDDALRKRLKRFANETDFNLIEANKLINDALLKRLRKIDSSFAADMEAWFTKLLDDYKTIILTVPASIASRRDVMTVLSYELFIPSTTVFLKKFQKPRPDSPNINRWFESNNIIAVKEVLSWWMQTYDVSEKALIDSLSELYEDPEVSLQRWKTGKTLPVLSTLHNFKQLKLEGKDDLVIWLLLARVWQYLLKLFADDEENVVSFLDVMRTSYRRFDEFSLQVETVEAHLIEIVNNYGVGRDLYVLQNLITPMVDYTLLNTEKAAQDEIKAEKAIKEFEQYEHCSYYFSYFSEYAWGRYYSLKAEYKLALEHYQKAFEHGVYRAGNHLLEILRELLTLAAYLGNKNIIKRHYRWACAMGLFSKENNALEQWEIQQLRMAFFNLFPVHYQCVAPSKKAEIAKKREKVFHHEALSSEKTIKKWQNSPPDLRHPNRWIKGLGPKPVTQLMIFSQWNQNDKVKRLLEQGADINLQSSDGGTALLIAIQNNNTEVAELFLQHTYLSKETINARTKRKKLTALQLAIDKGYVDIIRRLIDKGADIEQTCYITESSMLYYTLANFNHVKNYQAIGLSSVPKENTPADLARRLSEYIDVFSSGHVFEQDFPNAHAVAMQMPEYQLFNMDFSTYLQIIDILLEAGSDVNKRDIHGFTPFLYSAEVGELDIFRRFYEAGGNLTDCLDNGANIISIALSYSKFDIAAYILEHGDKEQLRQIINTQNKTKGFTALHHFLISFKEFKKHRLYSEEKMNDWQQQVWEKLLDLEPDLTLKDKMRLTAEMFADNYGMPSFALELHSRAHSNKEY